MAKDAELHKLVWECLLDGTELYYKGQHGMRLRGRKESGGIMCFHCHAVVSASKFEAHAKHGKRKKPYSYIYIKSKRVSLHEWSTSFSQDSSHNLNNSDERVMSNENGQMDGLQAGEGSGYDIPKEVEEDCSSILQADEGCTACMLCGSFEFHRPPAFDSLTILLCDQCNRECHVGCIQYYWSIELKELPEAEWFCSLDCASIHASLDDLRKRGGMPLNELVDVLQMGPYLFPESIKLQVINNAMNSAMVGAVVLDAVHVLRAAFPGLRNAEGHDLVPLLVNGSGEEYRGMHCMVLLVNSEVVSAAVFRVFSAEVAELPLIATHEGRRKQGYFKIMFEFFQRLLCKLGVEKIMLPASKRAEYMWTNRLGFSEMEDGDVSRFLNSYPSIVRFGDTKMLWKRIPKYTSK